MPSAFRSSEAVKRRAVAGPVPRSIITCSLKAMFSPLPCASVSFSVAVGAMP